MPQINPSMGLICRHFCPGFNIVSVSAENSGSLSLFSEFYNNILIKEFPDENERGSLDEFLQHFNEDKFRKNPDWQTDLIIDENNDSAAGIIYSEFPLLEAISVQFIVVKKQHRGKGFATRLLSLVKEKVEKHGGYIIKWMFLETHKSDGGSGTRKFWELCGVKIIDFDYLQPAMSGRRPSDSLQLCVKSFEQTDFQTIDTRLVSDFILQYSEKSLMVVNANADESVMDNLFLLNAKGGQIELKSFSEEQKNDKQE